MCHFKPLIYLELILFMVQLGIQFFLYKHTYVYICKIHCLNSSLQCIHHFCPNLYACIRFHQFTYLSLYQYHILSIITFIIRSFGLFIRRILVIFGPSCPHFRISLSGIRKVPVGIVIRIARIYRSIWRKLPSLQY